MFNLLYNVTHALQQVTKAVNKMLASNKKAVYNVKHSKQ